MYILDNVSDETLIFYSLTTKEGNIQIQSICFIVLNKGKSKRKCKFRREYCNKKTKAAVERLATVQTREAPAAL